MTQKLTEEQQRSAHKIIKANRGDCAYKGNYLNCWDCPRAFESSRCEGPLSKSKEFQAENLRRSQAWLDAHITDAEIMAESPQEFCERMVRTDGKGKCKGMTIFSHTGTCKNCVLFINKICSEKLNLLRAQAYLASHPATPQEPPKRRPTPEEMLDYVEPEKVVEPTPISNTHALRIIALEGQVDDLTKKLAASKKLCDRQQRRLLANWEAKRDEEMCTHGELDLWLEKKRGCAKVTTLWNMPNKYDSVPKDWEIRPNGRTDWIPATRGNLKL